MHTITRAALILLLAVPDPVFAQGAAPSTTCTTPTAFEIAQATAVTAHSGGYYAARQTGVSFTPESWSKLGLGLTAATLDTSGAMAWGVGPKWYRRVTDSDDFSATLFAQVLAGKMDTAVTIAPETKGSFVQPGLGVSLGYKNYTVGLEADYAVAPRLAAGTERRAGSVRGSRVLLRLGYGFKHYSGDSGACAAPEARAAQLIAKEAERRQRATTQARLELGVSANGPQHPYADMPGVALSASENRPMSSAWGVAAVQELDSSYVRKGLVAGARVYSRSAAVQEGRFGVTAFAQVLGGISIGGQSGIIHSTGGATVQPGVGLVLGGGQRAFLVQFDYRFVRGVAITDDHMPGFTRSMSGKRISFGWVWRLDRR